MRSVFIAVLGAVLLLSPAWAQNKPAATAPAAPAGINEDKLIDELLSQRAVLFGHAAWLAGRAAGTFDDTVTPTRAAALAVKAGWGAADLTPTTPLDLKTYAQVLVKSLSLPTGLVYGWFPGPRYALRELVFRRIVSGALDPESPVSGEDAMRYLQTAQDWKEAQK